jgi:hypothetical protein
MNQYGRMALEFSQQYRPKAFAQLEDPERFFTEAGQEIAAEIAQTCDQLLGSQQDDETPQSYRRRSSQAWRTAEELVLADHWLLSAETESQDQEVDTSDDPELAAYYRDLAAVNETITRLYE